MRFGLRTLLILVTIGCVLLSISRSLGAASALVAFLLLAPALLEWGLWCREKEQVRRHR